MGDFPLQEFWLALRDLIFPPRCWLSQVAIAEAIAQPGIHGGLADPLLEELETALHEPYCFGCGSTVGPYSATRQKCTRCLTRRLGGKKTWICRVGSYHPPLSDLIGKLKFQGHWELAPWLARYLARALALAAAEPGFPPIDALVPIPLHWSRQWRRGFNQAAELAEALGRLRGIPVCQILRRTRATQVQSHTTSRTQRQINLHQAFAIGCREQVPSIAGRQLWLLDDVSTSGATLRAACSLLRRLPPQQRPAGIHALVLAIA